MALDADILGQALYNRRKAFLDKQLDELVGEYGSLDGVRLAMAKADAEEMINHFKNSGEVTVNVQTTGTASAQTGTGTGKIK